MNRALILSVLFLGVEAGRLPAQIAFEFDQPSGYTVYQGNYVDISVSLKWTGGSPNLLSTTGLATAAVGLRFSNSTDINGPVGNVTDYEITPAGTIIANVGPGSTQFEDGAGVPPDSESFFGYNKLVGLSLFNIIQEPTVDTKVFLGTFRFWGNTVGSMTIEAGLLNNDGNTITLGDNTPYDSFTSASSVNFTVQAVPEPGTMALLGLSLAGMAGVHRWRKRRCSCEEGMQEVSWHT